MSSSDLSSVLTSSHKSQLSEYLKFFRAKNEEQLKELALLFDETKEMRLLEEMYSQDDVIHILESLRNLMRTNLSEEFQKFGHQSALFLQQIFLQAEGHGVSLQLDTHTLDDQIKLAGIEKLDLESRSGRLEEPTNKAKLAAISGAADVKLVTKVKELEESNKSVLIRLEKVREQAQKAEKEIIELKDENAELARENSELKRDMKLMKDGNQFTVQEEIEKLREMINQLKNEMELKDKSYQEELKRSELSLLAKVNQSTQFQELKKLLLTRNQQLKELREQLKKQ
jgi:leucine zipper transcription factor-like protein 1